MSIDYPIRLPPSPEILTDRLSNPDPVICHLAIEFIRGKLQKSALSGEVGETIMHKQQPQTQLTYQSAWAK